MFFPITPGLHFAVWSFLRLPLFVEYVKSTGGLLWVAANHQMYILHFFATWSFCSSLRSGIFDISSFSCFFPSYLLLLQRVTRWKPQIDYHPVRSNKKQYRQPTTWIYVSFFFFFFSSRFLTHVNVCLVACRTVKIFHQQLLY